MPSLVLIGVGPVGSASRPSPTPYQTVVIERDQRINQPIMHFCFSGRPPRQISSIVDSWRWATAVELYNSYRLGDEGGGGSGLVAPGGGQDTDSLVVAGQTVDTGLDQNQAELGVLVLAVALEVLADGDGLIRYTVVVSINTRGLTGRTA